MLGPSGVFTIDVAVRLTIVVARWGADDVIVWFKVNLKHIAIHIPFTVYILINDVIVRVISLASSEIDSLHLPSPLAKYSKNGKM